MELSNEDLFMKTILFTTFLLLLFSSATSFAQNQPYTPERGSAERQAIVDALRAPVEKKLKKKTIFKLDHLKAQKGWVFVRGVPQMPDGSPMDYDDTVYKQEIEDGVFDDWICALLRKENNKWKVVVYVIGATDVVYEGWDKKYKAPSAIFR